MDRHIRYLATHNSQRSGRQPFCTHFVVDDSDELCSEDLATLQALESALAPPNQLAASMPDHLKLTGSSPLSSMGHLEFPMVVQSGWLRACWKAKQRVDETAYLLSLPDSMAAARQESADTVPVPVSNRSDSQVMAESAKHVTSSRRSRVSGVGADSNGLAIPILRPQSSTSGSALYQGGKWRWRQESTKHRIDGWSTDRCSMGGVRPFYGRQKRCPAEPREPARYIN
ncbi:hypothetical protein DL89DRAFT_168104 [Linderina pennispora]|uniref:BRCT domain-containing protein n=1 Tax=Linderina pennispora TaxID=61395 RepID=A0A1Y1VV25_9FUNG|nr:uncharacterized protein DL89DRAFT_168104 [Linderina pennispora]ORX64614.1 hypothetical protein DL89DRAFT_168104 [Linderina pennispora]